MAEINYGEHEGITVFDKQTHVVVEVPKFERNVVKQFMGKVGNNFYSTYVNDKALTPAEGNSLLAISKSYLRSDDQIRDFNMRLNEALKIHSEIKMDFNSIHDVIKFDLEKGDGKGIVPRYGQDEDLTKFPVEPKKWAYGTVIAVNDNYVAITAGESADARFARILSKDKFLLTKEEEANPAEANKDRFKVGEYVKLNWIASEGKGTKITIAGAEKKLAKGSEEIQEQAKSPVADGESTAPKRSHKKKEAAAHA